MERQMQRVQEWVFGVVIFVLLFWGMAVAKGDDAGFTSALNAQRSAIGLTSVAIDSHGQNVSYTNNVQQRSRGLGHWYTGPYGQCAAVGACNADQALRMWAASPAHAALIFSPALVSVGFHCDGWCASVACSFGTTQPVPLTTCVVARPSMPIAGCGTGWCGQRPRFRFFRRIR